MNGITITDWLTAIGTDGTVLIAILAAIPAYRAVREARQLREDQARPFVTITLEPSRASRKHLDLVVKNIGATVARDVRFLFSEPLRSTGDATGFPLANVKFLHDGIAVLAPGAEYRALFDFIPGREQAKKDGAALPDSYTATVIYKNRNGDNLPSEEYVLDYALSRGSLHVEEFGLTDLVKEARELRQTLQQQRVTTTDVSRRSSSNDRHQWRGTRRPVQQRRRRSR